MIVFTNDANDIILSVNEDDVVCSKTEHTHILGDTRVCLGRSTMTKHEGVASVDVPEDWETVLYTFDGATFTAV